MVEAANLAVIGAGPKAAAVAARVAAIHVWRRENPAQAVSLRPPPHLHIFERSGRAAAHWYGDDGYTDGMQEVCTPPEFDVVAPTTTVFGTLELEPFEWRTYVTTQGIAATNPTHRQFAEYIAWAIDAAIARANGGITLHTHAEVTKLRRDGSRWAIDTKATAEPPHDGAMRFDGVVVTSPGPAQQRFHVDAAVKPRVSDAQAYWSRHRARVRQSVAAGHRIAVIGAGGSAAAICVDVLGTLTSATPDPGGIVLVAPQATLFTRGETTFETQILTDAAAWTELPREARRQVAEHLLSGVVFRRVLEQLEGLAYLPAFFVGRAIAAVAHDRGSVGLWCLALDERITLIEADWVIDASGFDPLWFTDLLDEPSRTILRRLGAAVLGELLDPHLRLEVGARMFEDTSIIEALIPLEPALHVPFLAGGSRPPGRASLLQLGRLAEEILQPYLR
jgi:mycobactin lysine-N-oxygenase